MMFSELKIFSNNQFNAFCDNLYSWIGKNNLLICGGVARCLAGESHVPKDLDIVTINETVFNYIHRNIDHKFGDDTFVSKITKSDKRIIIYTNLIAVELWNGKTIHAQGRYSYQGVLPYIMSNRMKKIKPCL